MDATNQAGEVEREDAWSDFFNDHLTDGNDGYRPADVITRCRGAFDAAWPNGWEAANAAAVAVLATQPATSPMKMAVDRDWLDAKIAADPDAECDAGVMHPEAPQPATSQEGKGLAGRLRNRTQENPMMAVRDRELMLEAAEALAATPTPPTLTREVELQAEINRLRNLLIDPGAPAWEDARAVLVAEMNKGGYCLHAEYVGNGHPAMVPSHIALNLIALARTDQFAAGQRDMQEAAAKVAKADNAPKRSAADKRICHRIAATIRALPFKTR